MWFPYFTVAVLLLQPASAGSILFSGGTVIAFDVASQSLQVIRNGSVHVTDDRITAVFNSSTPSLVPNGTEVVDITDKIIAPGFIDTHKHGWQTAFKTLGSNTTLNEYFNRYGEFASDGSMDAHDVYVAQAAGLYEALNTGTTSILEHASHTWSEATAEAGFQACIDSGSRAFWAYTFHHVSNFTIEQQMTNFRSIALNASFDGTPTTLGISYDTFGPNPNKTEVDSIMSLVDEFNVSVVTTHTLMGPWGITNSPSDLYNLGYLNISTPIVFSHGSFLTDQDRTLLRSSNQFISITPESEMHYGHTHPHSHLVLENAALGIDTHFTYSADILTQARIWLQSVRIKLSAEVLDHWQVASSSPMSVYQAFLLATRHGAKALRREDLGIIAVGAKADLVVWDGTSPSLLGWVDPVAAIILHASVADVEHVLVDGKFVKKDGKLVFSGYKDLQKQFLKSARVIQKKLIDTPLPSQEGTFYNTDSVLTKPFVVSTESGTNNGYGQLFLEV